VNIEPVLILSGFAFLAGLMDAIAGGGGLILVPALFAVFPDVSPATLLGTNKLSSIAGTFVATLRYGFSVPIDWRRILPAALCAGIGAVLGAKTVTLLDPSVLRPAIVVLLVLVAAYTLLRPGMGIRPTGNESVPPPVWLMPALATLAGFYDGFFGPGAGSFMIFGLVRWFGYDFLRAAAAAKVLNFSTNFGAVVLFAVTGNILYLVALPLAACSIAGALIGSHLAIRRGAPLIRAAFLAVVLALVAKIAWDWLR
jgi:uncharacterized membrane protein YfcA